VPFVESVPHEKPVVEVFRKYYRTGNSWDNGMG